MLQRRSFVFMCSNIQGLGARVVLIYSIPEKLGFDVYDRPVTLNLRL